MGKRSFEFADRAWSSVARLVKQRGTSWAGLARQVQAIGGDFTAQAAHNKTRVDGTRGHLSLDEAVWISRALGVTVDDLVNPACSQCGGCPPTGFTCNTCSRVGAP